MICLCEKEKLRVDFWPLVNIFVDAQRLTDNDNFYFVSDSLLDINEELINWFKQLENYFGFDGSGFYFQNEEDALLFKLRWI